MKTNQSKLARALFIVFRKKYDIFSIMEENKISSTNY